MPNYIRAQVPGGSYFFTVALLNRKQKLLVENIDLLRQAFRLTRAQKPFTIDAIVIMPDHLHCIWTLPENDSDYSSRWKAIKTRFSKSIPNDEQRSVRRMQKGERGIWQRRFWEHAIRDERDLHRHIDYIHYNPVKHGYVEQATQWQHSSIHRFIKNKHYPPDWGASESVQQLDFE